MIIKHIFSKNIHQIFNKLALYNNVISFDFASIDSPIDSKQKIQLIRKQTWFQDYQTATKYNSQSKYSDALKSYYKVIQTMEQKNQKGQPYYYKIFQKILKINVLLDRPLQTQQNLYRLIKVKKALQKNPILVYQDYQNLMIHQLNHNVQKSIKLGKALLSQSQINNLPINNQKHIRMLLGNAYFLVDNFPDAKKKYGQVLQMKPSYSLRGKTLNNLAMACWWHKNPMFPIQQSIGSYEQIRINRDFKQTKQLFMNSIGALQNIDELSQKQAVALQSLLNENVESMLNLSSKSGKEGNIYRMNNRDSLRAAYNLIQYYIYNDPIQKPLILAWMRILLKGASILKQSNLIDEISSKYYLVNNDISQLRKLLKNIQKRIQQNQKTNKNDNSISQMVYRLNMYKIMNMMNRMMRSNSMIKNKQNKQNKQGNNIYEQQFKIDQKTINNLQRQITSKDAYRFKREFILGEELSFMKNQQKI